CPATTYIYTLSLHDALPIYQHRWRRKMNRIWIQFLKDRRLLIICYILSLICIIAFFHLSKQANIEYIYPFILGIFFLCIYLVIRSEEHTSELQSRENLVCRL